MVGLVNFMERKKLVVGFVLVLGVGRVGVAAARAGLRVEARWAATAGQVDGRAVDV